MTVPRRALVVVIIAGGFAVLASYGYGFVSYPDVRWEIWGGVPDSLQPVYSVFMVLAAVGFFPFTLFIILRLNPRETRMAGRYGYSVFITFYVLIMAGSAAWMPLTYSMIVQPASGTWLAIRVVLGTVAVGSLGLLGSLLTVRPGAPSSTWYRLAIAGCVLFNIQTVVLDALVWTAYYPF